MPQQGGAAKADGFVRTFAAIGLMSFGGPAGQIATMHRELIDKRQWFDEATFLGALNFCMLLPGPEAQQLATWCGWRLRGLSGGLVAGLLFIFPGALVMAALAAVHIAWGALPAVAAVFAGVQAAVVAVVAQALARVAGRTLKTPLAWGFAMAAFALIVLFGVPFPVIVALAAAGGALSGVRMGAPPRHGAAVVDAENTPGPHTHWRRSMLTLAIGGTLWLAPLALVAATLGPGHGLFDLGRFFAQLAAASFGGAYAGLAYVAQSAAGHGWVTPGEIVDGLALAETTPGPLVLTYQFVGALAGNRIPGPWSPAAGAAIGMALVLWVTFAPSFALVLALAPLFDRLLAQPRLARALAGVSAAVAGVIASLALWFALHVLFDGVAMLHVGPLQFWQPIGAPNLFAAGVAVAALMLFRAGAGMAIVLGLAAAAGLLRWATS